MKMTHEEYQKIESLLSSFSQEVKQKIQNLSTVSIGRSVDYTGQKFNKLLVLARAPSQGKKTMWWTLCDCGTVTEKRIDSLLNGHTTSCGCSKIDIVIANNKRRALDLTNQIFGYLKPLYPTEKRDSDNSIIWHCLCTNDNVECDVSSHKLRAGTTCSCGCMTESRGELKIKTLLQKHNIPFDREVSMFTFPSGKSARFDFCIDNKYLIEYDGDIHFVSTSGWNTPESLIRRQERDKIKNQWCKENNIPLIRIPYFHYNNLSIEDLLLETSKYIVKEDEGEQEDEV